MRRVVHPAKILSPRLFIHPARNRVSSLLKRIHSHTRQRRHILIAALAGHVTRSLARCLRRRNIQIHCLRSRVRSVRQVRVVRSLHSNGCSILIKIGLLQRKLSLPRISLITVLSTSGRNFLQTRHSLVRAVKQTTHRIQKRTVLCTSGLASDVTETVSRARHHHTVRVTCGRTGNVAPRPVRQHGGNGSVLSFLSVSHHLGTRRLRTTCRRGRRLPLRSVPRLVNRLRGRVGRTTGGLRFRRTTGCHSHVGALHSRLLNGQT